MGILSIVPKIVAGSFQWLNVDVIGQGEKAVCFQKSQGDNIGFHEKSQGEFMLFG